MKKQSPTDLLCQEKSRQIQQYEESLAKNNVTLSREDAGCLFLLKCLYAPIDYEAQAASEEESMKDTNEK